jgi:hypothetical protein
MSDQKINVDININADSLRQIPEYKAAFDNLSGAINNLNKEVLKYNTQNKESVNWGTKIKTTVKDLVDTFKSFNDIIDIATDAFKGWQGILSAAFTIITTYGPDILDFLGNMFQSDKTKEAAQALKDYKEVMASYIDNVSGEVSQLSMLLNIANDENQAKQTRAEALKKLNDLSPEYLNNLTLENLKTKEGKQLIDEYINSLNRKAMEEAVQAKRTEYVKQRLELKDEYTKAKAEEDAYKTGKKKNKQSGYSQTTPGGVGSTGTYIVTNSIDDAYENFSTVAEKDKKILAQIKKLDDTLAQSLIKYAPKPNLNQAKDKSYWETELANQQLALNKLEAGTKDFETKSKPIINRIRAINKTLSNYAVIELKATDKKKKNKKDPTKEQLEAREKAYQDSLIKQMQATANGLAKKAELQHNSYTEEQATLKRLYDSKLINQEQYQQESTQLEEKYHVGVGEIIKRMNAEDLEKVQKQQKDLVEAQQQKELLAKDQHDVDKAILPWNKLEAEKKLITDKYNFEIQKAAEAGKDTAALRLEYQEKITEATKKSEEQRKAFAIQAAQEISSKAFSLISNSIKSSSEAKIKGLESDKAKELSNTNLTKSQKAAIEAKYKKKENDEKVKAFKAEQKLQIAQALINGAIAVTKTLSTMALPAAIPFIAADVAMTAIQIATIASQKPPQFARGGQFVSDGRGALLPGYSRTDNTNAYLRSGEAVVVSEAMRNPWARNLVSAINVAHGGRDFSAPNPGNGYAIGGIFTDGGNANRYYNQPVNDVKELANTVAYQMINNFPPIYVDVKDVNNQQNILAQTVDRVNL